MYIELTKKIHEQMASHQFVVSIMGNFNQEFLKSLIKMTDNKLATLDVNESIKKRIFHFMVECAQNICKSDEENSVANSLFLIGKKNEDYSVYLGSVFDKDATPVIIETVNEVNALTAPELKEKFYEEMKKKGLQQNQLLMSLLDLSKRIKEKIQYEEFAIDDATRFLSFQITLSNFKA